MFVVSKKRFIFATDKRSGDVEKENNHIPFV